VVVITVKKVGVNYTIITPKGFELTPFQYFESDDKARKWAECYISSYLGWTLNKEILND